MSLTFYVLASVNRNSEFSTEAGLKYFILGAFSSSLLLFGFSLLYSFTGLTNLQDLLIFFSGYYFTSMDIFNIGVLAVGQTKKMDISGQKVDVTLVKLDINRVEAELKIANNIIKVNKSGGVK